MQKHNVNVIGLKGMKAFVQGGLHHGTETLPHLLCIKSFPSLHRPDAHLRLDDDLLADPFDHLSHHDLILPPEITSARVKKVDADFQDPLYQGWL